VIKELLGKVVEAIHALNYAAEALEQAVTESEAMAARLDADRAESKALNAEITSLTAVRIAAEGRLARIEKAEADARARLGTKRP